jgi:hypothetical protein
MKLHEKSSMYICNRVRRSVNKAGELDNRRIELTNCFVASNELRLEQAAVHLDELRVHEGGVAGHPVGLLG